MLGKYWIPEREPLIASIKSAFLEKAMACRYDIVIDNMNLNPKEEEYFINIIKAFNEHSDTIYILEFKDFLDISLEECIKRNSKRTGDDYIDEEVILETYNRYKERIDKLKQTR